jgi:hypothetical protein
VALSPGDTTQGAPNGVNVRWLLKPTSGSPNWGSTSTCQANVTRAVPTPPATTTVISLGRADPLVAAYAPATCTAAVRCGVLYVVQAQTRGGTFGALGTLAESAWTSSATLDCYTGCGGVQGRGGGKLPWVE